MTKKKTNEDLEIKVKASGKEYKIEGDPAFLGTKPIRLTRSKPIQAVNMLLPPGVSRFYIERINKNKFRFLIRTDEITRLSEKAEEMMKTVKAEAKAKKEIKVNTKTKAEA
jgi:hypothetical protein